MSFTEVSSATQVRSVSTIMGQVLFLVAAALGVCALGTVLGQDLSFGTARVLSLVGFGMLIAQSFVASLRYGALGIGWLAATAAVIGFGLGPTIDYYATVAPNTLTSALLLTTLTLLGMAAIGFAMSRDTVGWMRPLSFIVLGCIGVSLIALVFGGLRPPSPVLSPLILPPPAPVVLVGLTSR